MDEGTQSVGSSVSDVTREARAAWASMGPADISVDNGSAEGTSPEATPESDTPQPEPAAPEAETPPAPEQAQLDPQQTDTSDGPDKFWNQYKTDEERRKGLYETKRYAADTARKLREAEIELAKLRAPQAQPPQAAPAAAPTPPQVQYVPGKPVPQQLLTETLVKLQDEDPGVRQAMQSLGTIKDNYDKLIKERAELATSLATTDNEILKLGWTVEHYKSLAERTPDEDTKAQLQDAVEKYGRKLEALEVGKTKREVRQQLIDLETERLQAHWASGTQQLREFVTSHLGRETEQAQEQERVNVLEKEARSEWDSGLISFGKKHNITDPDEIKDINRLLLYQAQIAIREDRIGNDPGELQKWMLGPEADEAVAFIKRQHERSVKRYAEAKRSDASQPAPAGRATGKVSQDENETPSPRHNLDSVTREAKSALLRSLGAR